MTPIIDGSGLCQWLLKSSGQAAVLVVLVLMAQGLLRHRLAPRWRHALWWLVVLRLVLPVSFESLVSVYNLAPQSGSWALPKQVAPFTSVASPVALADVPSEPSPALKAVGDDATRVEKFESRTDVAPEPIIEAIPLPVISAPAKPPTALASVQTAHAPLTWQQILTGVWLAGACVLVFHVVQSQLRLRRRIAGARILSDPALLSLLDQCRQAMGVRRSVALLELDEVDYMDGMDRLQSPALCGFFSPCLLLPKGLVEQFSETELRHVFLHELAHLKRHDIAANWLTTVAQIVHWFNPLLWLGFSRMRADREPACDALALAATAEDDRKAYGHTIIKLLDQFSQTTPVPGLVGILENKNQLAQRIRMIAQFGRHYQGRAIAICLIAGLGAVGLTDGIREGTKEDNTITQTSVDTAVIPPRPIVTNGPALKVTVLDANTSKPIPGAMVYAPCGILFDADEIAQAPRWTTDTSGVALVHLGEVSEKPELKMGSFFILIHCPPYAPAGMGWNASQPAITNIDAHAMMPKEVTVQLKPGVKIGGTVKNEQGEPVSNIQIQAIPRWDHSPRFPSEDCDRIDYGFCGSAIDNPVAITDQAGHWEMTGSARCLGDMLIKCDGSNTETRFISPTLGSVSYGYLPVFWSFPEMARNFDATELLTAMPQSITTAELLENRAVLTLTSRLTVWGTIVAPDGKPLPGVKVLAGYAGSVPNSFGECQTDKQGRFERHFANKQPIVITAYPTNYAVTSLRVDAGQDAANVRLQVQPLSPFRLRVIDGAGKPLGGNTVSVAAYYNHDQLLEFHGAPDSDGTVVWSNAPRVEFMMQVHATNMGVTRWLRIDPGQREVTCQLRPEDAREIQIHGKVRDIDTGKEVELASLDVRPIIQGDVPIHERIDRSEFVMTIPAKQFSHKAHRRFTLVLCAAGYDTLITKSRSFDEGGWDTVFLMKKGGKRSGQIVTENGIPVDGARVYCSTLERHDLPAMKEPGRLDTFKKTTDGEGRFEVEHIGKDTVVLILHEQGMAVASLDKLTHNPKLILQPWGRVEGTVRVGTKPQSAAKVTLQNMAPDNNSWPFSYEVRTDGTGRFVFDKVPPGECYLFHNWYHVITVQVKSGETTTANYGGNGRPIVARLSDEVDWSRYDPELAGKLVFSKKDPRPNYTQRMYFEVYFDKTGHILIDDVPPGTYELCLQGGRPQNYPNLYQTIPGAIPTGFDRKELAWLIRREVVVPEMPGGRSDTPLDLGTITLNWKDPSYPDFPVKTKSSKTN